jgi:hypothetical protein
MAKSLEDLLRERPVDRAAVDELKTAMLAAVEAAKDGTPQSN